MLPLLAQKLITEWPHLGINRIQPTSLNFLGIRTHLEAGYAFFLAFAEDDELPTLAIKVSRGKDADISLRQEFENLSYLEEKGLTIQFSIPRPLFFYDAAPALALVISAPRGTPLVPDMNHAQEDFFAIGDWLAHFANATKRPQSTSFLNNYLNNLSAQFFTIFDEWHEDETAVIQTWIERSKRQTNLSTINSYMAHSNLCHNNIWQNKTQTNIFNWELAIHSPLLLQDIFTFATKYNLPTRRRGHISRFQKVFQQTFFDNNSYSQMVSKTIFDYCSATNFPKDQLDAQFGLFLMDTAVREYNQCLTLSARGYLPLVHANKEGQNMPYQQKIKNQIGINLLRYFMQESASFQLSNQIQHSNQSSYSIPHTQTTSPQV